MWDVLLLFFNFQYFYESNQYELYLRLEVNEVIYYYVEIWNHKLIGHSI